MNHTVKIVVLVIQSAILSFVLMACVTSSPSGSGAAGSYSYANERKVFANIDKVYDKNIKSVQFYPVIKSSVGVTDYPVLSLNEQATGQLMLEFDEMGNNYRNYYFKIIACNADWTTSMLQDLEYLSEFNEYVIDDYEISLNTRTSYVHYKLRVPKVKLSGNYMVMVYRDRNLDDFVLGKRFVVFERLVGVNPQVIFPLDPARRFNGQQVDFTISYGSLDLFNPQETVKLTLRQNGRWDNAIYNLKPVFIREEDHLLDYHFFNNENVFDGLNEYRTIDIRSMRVLRQGMESTRFDNNGAWVKLMTDTVRNKPSYNQWIDINGLYVIENFETKNGSTEADYVNTLFTFQPPKNKILDKGAPFVFGAFSNWELKEENRMALDSASGNYKLNIKMKQGFYNYAYAYYNSLTNKVDEVSLEGSYNLTENRYDIIVYFRPIGSRYDKVIGYTSINYMKR